MTAVCVRGRPCMIPVPGMVGRYVLVVLVVRHVRSSTRTREYQRPKYCQYWQYPQYLHGHKYCHYWQYPQYLQYPKILPVLYWQYSKLLRVLAEPAAVSSPGTINGEYRAVSAVQTPRYYCEYSQNEQYRNVTYWQYLRVFCCTYCEYRITWKIAHSGVNILTFKNILSLGVLMCVRCLGYPRC